VKRSILNLPLEPLNPLTLQKFIRKELTMPVVNIVMAQGRPSEKKEELIRNVTEAIASTLNLPKESVDIVLQEVPRENFGHGGIPLTKMKP
jgi:4-oxalocrotonate tautomerase